MSVTEVRPWANTEGGVDAEGNQNYTNVYHVYTDDKNDGADTARFSQAIALGLPAYNDIWSWYNDFNIFAIAKTRHTKLAETDVGGVPFYRKWEVTIGYTSKGQHRDSSGGGGGSGGAGTGEPAAEPWKISGSYAMGTRLARKDKDDKLITNSAEEPKTIEVPSGRDTLILDGNSDYIDLVKRSLALGKCNENPQWGLQHRQALLMQWTYEILHKADVPYVHHHMEWWIAPDDELWNYDLADIGTRYIDPANIAETDQNKRYTPFTSRDLQSSEGWLDGSGGQLNVVNFPDGVFLEKRVIKEYDFIGNLTFLPDPLPGPFV